MTDGTGRTDGTEETMAIGSKFKKGDRVFYKPDTGSDRTFEGLVDCDPFALGSGCIVMHLTMGSDYQDAMGRRRVVAAFEDALLRAD